MFINTNIENKGLGLWSWPSVSRYSLVDYYQKAYWNNFLRGCAEHKKPIDLYEGWSKFRIYDMCHKKIDLFGVQNIVIL